MKLALKILLSLIAWPIACMVSSVIYGAGLYLSGLVFNAEYEVGITIGLTFYMNLILLLYVPFLWLFSLVLKNYTHKVTKLGGFPLIIATIVLIVLTVYLLFIAPGLVESPIWLILCNTVMVGTISWLLMTIFKAR